MFRKIVILFIIGLSTLYFLRRLGVKNVVGATRGGSNVVLSLALDPYTKTHDVEDNQPFAILINASVPQDQPIAGLDATLMYEKKNISAIKVLAGEKSIQGREFENGYFGTSATVDSLDQDGNRNAPCYLNPEDQTERLKCAIDEQSDPVKGIVSITSLNLDGEDFRTISPDHYPNPQVTGDFTFATVIFMPKGSQVVGPTGYFELIYTREQQVDGETVTDYLSNAYSWVDITPARSQDSERILGDQSEAPTLPGFSIANETLCDFDLDRSGEIGGGDYAILFTEYKGRNCQIEFCRSDIDFSGAIGGGDYTKLLSEFKSGC